MKKKEINSNENYHTNKLIENIFNTTDKNNSDDPSRIVRLHGNIHGFTDGKLSVISKLIFNSDLNEKEEYKTYLSISDLNLFLLKVNYPEILYFIINDMESNNLIKLNEKEKEEIKENIPKSLYYNYFQKINDHSSNSSSYYPDDLNKFFSLIDPISYCQCKIRSILNKFSMNMSYLSSCKYKDNTFNDTFNTVVLNDSYDIRNNYLNGILDSSINYQKDNNTNFSNLFPLLLLNLSEPMRFCNIFEILTNRYSIESLDQNNNTYIKNENFIKYVTSEEFIDGAIADLNIYSFILFNLIKNYNNLNSSFHSNLLRPINYSKTIISELYTNLLSVLIIAKKAQLNFNYEIKDKIKNIDYKTLVQLDISISEISDDNTLNLNNNILTSNLFNNLDIYDNIDYGILENSISDNILYNLVEFKVRCDKYQKLFM